MNPDRYDWLSEFMEEPDKNGKVSFSTLANHFIWTLKTRESDEPYKNLHIRPMTLSSEQIDKMKQSIVQETKTDIQLPPIPSFSTPVFEAPINLTAFEPSFDDMQGDNSPF